jgi:hypothetical protein
MLCSAGVGASTNTSSYGHATDGKGTPLSCSYNCQVRARCVRSEGQRPVCMASAGLDMTKSSDSSRYSCRPAAWHAAGSYLL